MSAGRREGLKGVSLGLDMHNTNDNFMHSLRDATQKMSVAVDQRDGFIRENITDAAAAVARGDTKGADFLFGMVVHTIADKYSPVHRDAQGNPAIYPGPNHSRTDFTGRETSKHITASTMDAMKREIQAAHQQVYGKQP